jgi:hypothetical protein
MSDLADYAPARAESPDDLARDLEIIVYGKDFKYRQVLANPEYAFFTPTWASNGYGAFAVSPSHDVNEFLQEPGARIRVIYRGQFLMSGMIRSMRGSFLNDQAVVYQMSDGRRVLTAGVTWTAPKNPLVVSRSNELGQATGVVKEPGRLKGQEAYYLYGDESIRSAESMIKTLCREQLVDRLKRPIRIAPDLQRGGDVRAAGKVPLIRFDTVEEAAEPLQDWSGLGITVQHLRDQDRFLTLDVREPRVFPQPLSVASGAIVDGYWDRAAPSATRFLMGGPGGGAIRAWREYRNTAAEEEYGDVFELTRDAQNVEIEWPDGWPEDDKAPKYYHLYRGDSRFSQNGFDAFENGMRAKADIAMTAGAATSGLTLTLAEAGSFIYGGETGFQVGDIITVINGPEGDPATLAFDDQITECIVGQNMDKGSYATPKVGGTIDSPDKRVMAAIANLARQQRRSTANR